MACWLTKTIAGYAIIKNCLPLDMYANSWRQGRDYSSVVSLSAKECRGVEFLLLHSGRQQASEHSC